MGTNPNQPGYVPQVNPHAPHNVGHGAVMGADLFALWRAGRIYLPDTAAKYSSLASYVHDFQQDVAYLNSAVGGERALTLVEGMRARLETALSRTTDAMSRAGAALVDIAAMYVGVDQATVDGFNTALGDAKRSGDDFTKPTTTVTPPPKPGDPYRDGYTPPSRTDPLTNLLHNLIDTVEHAADGGD